MKKGIFLAMSMVFVASTLASCGHTHTFDSNWSSDETLHWKAATCEGHTDEKTSIGVHIDEVFDGVCDVCEYVICAHDYNGAGICVDCGYGTADVSTIAKAITVAKAQKSNVDNGTVTDVYTCYGSDTVNVSEYEFAEDYTIVKENGREYYYSLVSQDTVFGVMKYYNESGEAQESRIEYAVVENMNGPKINSNMV